jgi:4-aminobutyrate aminotransferase-like enzyme
LYTGIEFVLDRETKEPAIDLTTYVLDESIANGMLFEKGGYYYNRIQLIPSLNMDVSVMDEAFRRFDAILTRAEKLFL